MSQYPVKKHELLTYERMTRIQLMGYTIRVWETVEPCRDDDGRATVIPFGANHKYTVAVREAVTGEPGHLRVTHDGIADVLDGMPEVAAYEITDALGNGCVVYREWP